MWKAACNIYEKRMLLNQLAARRRFYSAVMRDSEKAIDFGARVRQLASSLKTMGVTTTEQDMAMTVLSGLPDRYDSLISALDALSDDTSKFTFEFVISRCMLEEQRHIQRYQESLKRAETAALLATNRRQKETCIHSGKHKDSSKCCIKHPHLAPDGHSTKNKYKALLGRRENDREESETDIICLLGNTTKSTEINSQ